MNLQDMIQRVPIPKPWSEGDNIPWNDPAFSKRMLREHLSQEHNAASRKFDRIDQHVGWIHQKVLSGKPSRILDLGCGPGLYANRLARLGHQCVGIDYSPASIAYARCKAQEDNLDCTFIEADIREAEFGTRFDAATLIFGELNVFKENDTLLILGKIFEALKPGGLVLLEPHTFDAVQAWGERSPSWYSSHGGLFSSKPHLVMEEYFWDRENHITTNRYFVIDGLTGDVTRYAQSLQAYTYQDYSSLMDKCGYTNIRFFPSLKGTPDPEQRDLLVILGTKP